jgi:hypothetical protein
LPSNAFCLLHFFGGKCAACPALRRENFRISRKINFESVSAGPRSPIPAVHEKTRSQRFIGGDPQSGLRFSRAKMANCIDLTNAGLREFPALLRTQTEQSIVILEVQVVTELEVCRGMLVALRVCVALWRLLWACTQLPTFALINAHHMVGFFESVLISWDPPIHSDGRAFAPLRQQLSQSLTLSSRETKSAPCRTWVPPPSQSCRSRQTN